MHFGVAYYPEHWPEKRWLVDAVMMQRAGVNMVRMGEFAWSAYEPDEGEVHFGWMEAAVKVLAAHNIKTMMCTPSRTPPPWAFAEYPAIRKVNADGRRSGYGQRYTVCLNSPTFLELAQRIDEQVMRRFARNDAVVAWHLDNEIGAGNACWCEVCREAFAEYLRAKYGAAAELNERWGTHFWSFYFNHFDNVPLPNQVDFPNPSLALEYARFQSKTNADFAAWRYNRLKELCPDKPVTTNFQGARADHTDLFDLGKATDVYGTNHYPPGADELALDYCRGKRGELLVLEQRSGQPHWSSHTKPGWMRLWAYQSLAHGACGLNFFRWRTCRWGQEEYWHGVLPHSGRENRRYGELKQMGQELQKLGPLIDATKPHAPVALLMSYESRWAMEPVCRPFNPAMLVYPAVTRWHEALMAQNVTVDAFDPREDLTQYELVIAPRLYCVDDEIAQNLTAYVEGGGVLCLTPRSGVVDQYNVVFEQPAPGPLCELAGVEVDDYGALDEPLVLSDDSGELGEGFAEATLWADEIQPTEAHVIATYAEGWLEGQPAATIHSVGLGHVIYVGTVLQGATLEAFISYLRKLAGADAVLETPVGVRAYERRGESSRLLFLLNFGEDTQQVDLGEAWQDGLTDETVASVELPPADLRVLLRPSGGEPS